MRPISDALHVTNPAADASASPTILPYPSVDAARAREQTSRGPARPGRFVFPELRESSEPIGPTSPTLVAWPKVSDAEIARASAATADGVLAQLSLERARVVAWTSPGDGDGKTSLLLGLAPHVARRMAGSVLVVDANLHKPDLTKRLGLASVAGDGPALIYPTNVPRLNVLPASGSSDSSRSGFSRAFLEDLREGWPLTLLDMASLAHGEAIPIARRCDGVCLVVRLGHTSRRAAAASADAIRRAGAHLLGCVVIG